MVVVLVTLFATLLIQCGYFLWKISADGQPRIGRDSGWVVIRALALDWRWMLGFAATALGWVLFVQATALGDISLVQPLMSSGDLLLVILAVVFLKERLGAIEWGGVLLTVLGAVALASQAQLSGSLGFSAIRLWGFLGVAGAVGVLLLLANRKSPRPEVLLAMVVGLCFGAGAVLTKAMTMPYSATDGSLISWRLLFDPYLLGVVLANVAGLVLLQAAFQRGRASVIVPLQLALANVITVAAGLMIFSEEVTGVRGAGIAMIIGGTVFLHFHPHKLD